MNPCVYFPACGGCSSWDTPYAEQSLQKTERLSGLFLQNGLELTGAIEFISRGEQALRERVDFTITSEDGVFKAGFYDRDKNLLAIEKCLQLTPSLQKIYSEFLSFKVPVRKGSVRLREGVGGLKGVWLDFANTDIKELLAEATWLRQLLHAGFIVEIGQKGKRLKDLGTQLKLSEPEAEAWFSTTGPAGEELLVMGLISDFTQPSAVTAKALAGKVLSWCERIPDLKSVIEFGPGLGQFTLGFLKMGLQVEAFEIDASATEQLRNNAILQGLAAKLKINLGDYQRKPIETLTNPQLAFVNPARSGLKGFTEQILKLRPEFLIYVSCFPESLTEDLKRMSEVYEIKETCIVDQFPQTRHFETAVFLKAKS